MKIWHDIKATYDLKVLFDLGILLLVIALSVGAITFLVYQYNTITEEKEKIETTIKIERKDK